jgi:hypothetical protein
VLKPYPPPLPKKKWYPLSPSMFTQFTPRIARNKK